MEKLITRFRNKNKQKTLLLNSKFKFGEEIKKAEVVDATDKNKVRVNGTEFFERIKLTKEDLKKLNYEERIIRLEHK